MLFSLPPPMIRSVIKQYAASLLGTALPLEYILKRSRNRYILSYHRVVPVEFADKFRMQRSMWVSVDTFKKDIDWFRRHGELVDMATMLDMDYQNDVPLFTITFDDGWIDNYKYAYPALKMQNIPATIFLVTSAVETGNIFWVEDFLYKVATIDSKDAKPAAETLSESMRFNGFEYQESAHDKDSLAEAFAESLKPIETEPREAILDDIYAQLGLDREPLKNEILDWTQIREMRENGISFGSHTHNHVILQYAEPGTIKYELETSRDILRNRLGEEAEYFCYPNARYRNDNADLLELTGYKYAFRMHNLPLKSGYDKYFIPRYLLNEHLCSDRNMLLCKLMNIPGF